MRTRSIAMVSAACAVALVATACGNDSEDDGGGGGGGGGGTLSVGLLTALTGPGSASAEGATLGAEARFAAYEEDGEGCAGSLDFEIQEADDASSPQGALAGVQQLVQQEEVYALLNVSAFFYGASQWITTQGNTTPVIGGAWDGAPEWKNTDDNLFNSAQVDNPEIVYSTDGEYLASQGATKVAGIAFRTPSSQSALASGLTSSEAAGLEVGYVNDAVEFGTTDVGPIVLGIMESGADAVFLTITPDTAFAVLAGLRQANYPLTAFVSPTGYGGDLLASEPAVQAAQGVTFYTATTPIEIESEATERMRQALIDHAGNESGIPGFYETQGWLTADLFLHGLEQAGCDASSEEFISTMQQDQEWDAGGLYPTPVPQTTIEYDERCWYYVLLEGEAFVPVDEATPLCGEPLES